MNDVAVWACERRFMTIRFRKVTANDLAAVHSLVQNSFESSLHPYMISTQSGAEAFLHVFVDHQQLYPERHFLLSEAESGELLGYAEFRLLNGVTGFLSYICVSPSARGQGIATRLIRHYLAQVPQAQVLELDVFTHNEAALALYHKLGFVSGDQNVWWLRDLTPQPEPENLSFEQLPLSLASLERYGFCELTGKASGRSFHMGVMGTTVLRCFDAKDFLDYRLLTNVAAVFPRLREALAILPAADHSPEHLAREINRSVRMTWAVSPPPQELQ